MKKSNKEIIIFLLLILLIGSFIRFYSLGSESFWLDEGATALEIKNYGIKQILIHTLVYGKILPEYYPQYDYSLPVYYIFIKLWANIFGTNEMSFRSFSALLGSMSLLLIFYLAKHLFDEKIAIMSTFLASINPTLIWFSQEARQYSFLLFLSLISLLFLLKVLNENKVKYLVGFLAVNFLIIYSQNTWMLFIFFEGAYALYRIYLDYIRKKAVNKKIILAFLLLFIFYIPIINIAIFSDTNTIDLYGRPQLTQIAKFGVQLTGWLYPSEGLRQKIYDFNPSLTFYESALITSFFINLFVIGIFFLVGLVKSYGLRKESSIFLASLFFVPSLLSLLISYVHPAITNIFMLKQVIYIIPAYLIIASVGIMKSKHKLLVATIIFITGIISLHAYYANLDKQQFRDAADFLKSSSNNDPIFINIDTAQVAFQFYYGESDNVVGVKDLEELQAFLRDTGSFWMLFTFTKYSDPEGSIRKFLDQNYIITEKKKFYDIELFHYTKE